MISVRPSGLGWLSSSPGTDRKSDRQTGSQTGSQTRSQTESQTGSQTDRQEVRQTDKKSDRKSDTHTHNVLYRTSRGRWVSVLKPPSLLNMLLLLVLFIFVLVNLFFLLDIWGSLCIVCVYISFNYLTCWYLYKYYGWNIFNRNKPASRVHFIKYETCY